MTRDEIITRRLIAAILGALGVMLLMDVMVIAIVQPEASYDGFRQVMFIIIGGLLVLSGAVTFSWPKKGGVETSHSDGSADGDQDGTVGPPDH